MATTELERALRNIAQQLDSRRQSWALIGGLAVGTRAEPRTTRDVDVVVAVDKDTDAEELVHSLVSAGYSTRKVLEHVTLGRLATVRLTAPGTGLPVLVDLLFASSGIEAEICRRSERLEIVPGLVVPVARAGHLIALKLLARDDRDRPQDYDDLVNLLRHSDSAAVELARSAVRCIKDVGGARGRDLEEDLDVLIASLTAQ